MKYIYESPDKGKTVYCRPSGHLEPKKVITDKERTESYLERRLKEMLDGHYGKNHAGNHKEEIINFIKSYDYKLMQLLIDVVN